MLKFEDVSFNYSSGLAIFRSFNLEVNLPRRIAIVGPSGIGKTTLLNLLAATVKAQTGRITLYDEEIKVPGPERVIVFQNYALLPWKSVWQNIELSLINSELALSEKEQRIREAIKLVKLDGFEKYYPSQLSGGMKQRVGIARAIVARPKLLLLDEPFAGLDALTRLELTSELSTLLEGLIDSMVLVTHNIEEALYLSDLVLVLNDRPMRVVGEFEGMRSHSSFLEVKQSSDFMKTELEIHRLLK